MQAVIISCGTELVTGQCMDTNSAWIAAQLTPLGIDVQRHITLGDDVNSLSNAVRESLTGVEITVMTGGLGPTLDDITRDALAFALDSRLEENTDALTQIRLFFNRWQRPMPDSNLRQTMIPKGCDVIPNPRGTAPGILFRRGNRVLAALPGVPAEMRAMFTASVLPLVSAQTGQGRTTSARLLCFGISEARLGETLADLMARGRNPQVGTTASEAVLSVRILSTAADHAESAQKMAADLTEIRHRLGNLIFGEGDETLESAVAKLLTASRRTLATAESCTGGLLAKRITDVPGSSAYFLRGYVTYSNEAKCDMLNIPVEEIARHGAVSEPIAAAMASRARAVSGADFALSITGIAGPAGGNLPEKPVGLVYIGLAGESGVRVEKFLMGEHLTRREIRDRSCKSAMNLLRLELLV